MPAYRKHEKTAQIVEMRKTMPMKDIAKALGISLSTVNYHCMVHRGSLHRGKKIVDTTVKPE